MNQSEARKEAKLLNECGNLPHGLVAVAAQYPRNSWGGSTKEWAVTYVPVEETDNGTV